MRSAVSDAAALRAIGQLLVEALQFVFGRELDLDSARLALSPDPDAGAEGEPELLFGLARVHVGGRFWRLVSRRAAAAC